MSKCHCQCVVAGFFPKVLIISDHRWPRQATCTVCLLLYVKYNFRDFLVRCFCKKLTTCTVNQSTQVSRSGINLVKVLCLYFVVQAPMWRLETFSFAGRSQCICWICLPVFWVVLVASSLLQLGPVDMSSWINQS